MNKPQSKIMLSLLVSAGLIAGAIPADAKSSTERVQKNEEWGTPSYIVGKWKAPKGVSKKDTVWAYLEAKQELFKLDGDMKDNFKILSAEEDKKLDTYHVRTQEVYKDIPIYGSDQTLALDEDGSVTAFFGQVIPNLDQLDVPTKAKIDKAKAVKIAKKDLEDDVEDAKFLDEQDNDKKKDKETEKLEKKLKTEKSAKTEPKLFIYPHDNEFSLAYQVELAYIEPTPGRWFYFIDATNGDILHKVNVLEELTGTGAGVLGDSKQFQAYKSGSKYYMYDTTRGSGISTYNANHASYSSYSLPGSWVTSNSTNFTDPAAVDAHTYAEAVYDYYKNTHARNGYDNKGAAIVSSVHTGYNWNNAAWIGTQMVYGDGDGSTFIPLSGALDVVGHELTHAVTENTAGLIYENESGALNESMSDIFGAMIDRDDWLIGEDVYTPRTSGDALRNMADPAAYGDPDHYSKRYQGSEDEGGVHTNSSINNKAAYLMSDGGTHYGVTVKGIGRSATEKIYYRALTRYLTSTSNFSQMRQAAIQAATDLYGSTSQQVDSVKKAYDAVGVK